MKVISKRLSILKEKDLLSVVILPNSDRKKLWAVFVWLLLWSICGIIIAANYFKMTDSGTKIFFVVYLAFWLYYELRIINVLRWKLFGREKLWIQNGELHYQREINNRGKILEFNLDLVGKLELLELNKANFSDFINQSFWIKGGERLEFAVQSKVVRLGMQLNDEEARAVIREVNGWKS